MSEPGLQGSWSAAQIQAAFIRGQYDAIRWALTATRLPKHVWETFEAKGWELHRAIEGLPAPGIPLSSKKPVWVVIDVGCYAGGAGSEAVGIFWTPGEAHRAAEARDTKRLMSQNQEGDGCDIFKMELPMSAHTVKCFRCQGDGNIATYWEKGRCHNVKCPECGGKGNVPAKSWSGEESAAAWKRVGGK